MHIFKNRFKNLKYNIKVCGNSYSITINFNFKHFQLQLLTSKVIVIVIVKEKNYYNYAVSDLCFNTFKKNLRQLRKLFTPLKNVFSMWH